MGDLLRFILYYTDTDEGVKPVPIEWSTVTGSSPLALVNALAEHIRSLTQYGKCVQKPVDYLASVTQTGVCEQASTPTPTVPVDIKCNNGVLTKPHDTYTAVDGQGTYVTPGSTRIYKALNVEDGNYTISVPVAYDFIVQYKTPTDGPTPTDYGNVTSWLNGYTTVTLNKGEGYGYGIAIRDHNNQSGNITPADFSGTIIVVHDDEPVKPVGTPEVITDANGNTASAVNLLGVSEYADTQEFIAGAVGRQVGIYVCTGDESGWGTSSTAGIYTLAVGFGKGLVAICTHFTKVSNSTSAVNMSDGTFKGHSANNIVYFKDSSAETLDAFKAAARAAYASGNPWIIVYALSTATTESVPGQLLVKAPLTVTAEVTVPTLVTTTAAVSTPDSNHPLPVWCNNGVLTVSPNLFNPNSTYAIAKPCVVSSSSASFPNTTQTWANSLTYFFLAKPNTTYTYSCATKGNRLCVMGLDSVVNPTQYTTQSSLVFDSIFVNNGTSTPANRNYTFTTGANTQMVAVYCSLSTLPTDIQIEEGAQATAYHPYREVYPVGTPEVLTVQSAQLFDAANAVQDGNYINSNSGGLGTPSATGGTFVHSDFIPVKEGVTYFFGQTRYSASSAGIAWYSAYNPDDRTYTFIGGSNGSTLKNSNMKLTALEGAKWLRFSIRTDESYDPNWQNTVYLCECENDTPILTAYQPYHAPQTATVETLLGLGDYKDTHELIHGPVNRDVGCMAVDGYEGDWVKATSGSNVMFYRNSNLSAAANVSASGDIILCEIATHYKNSWTSGSNKIVQRSNKNFGFMNPTGFDINSTVEDWENYCKAHPFLVFYPLAQETAESTTPQHLSTAQGTNTVSATANVSAIQLSVEYAGGVPA